MNQKEECELWNRKITNVGIDTWSTRGTRRKGHERPQSIRQQLSQECT